MDFKLNSLQITTAIQGGAGIAVRRLHEGLISKNVNDSILTKNNFTPKKNLKYYYRHLRLSLKERIFYHAIKHEKVFKKSQCICSLNGILGNNIPIDNIDVINLHWIGNFVDLAGFFSFYSGQIPLVWTFHDQYPLLGSSHYKLDTDIISRTLGGNLPLGNLKRKDIDNSVYLKKQKIYEKIPRDALTIVCPSKHLANLVLEHPALKRFSVRHIPYGINTQKFCCKEKISARKIFNIPLDKKVILFIASSVDNEWKGFEILREAIGELENKYYYITVGESKFEYNNLQSLGTFMNETALAAIYSAADVFVTPTLEDNLPNTVLEAMACGTPVIGSNVGGVPDMVRHGKTGFLFECGSAGDLAAEIKTFFELPEEKRLEMKQMCRKIAVKEYDISVQAENYIKLYKELLNKK